MNVKYLLTSFILLSAIISVFALSGRAASAADYSGTLIPPEISADVQQEILSGSGEIPMYIRAMEEADQGAMSLTTWIAGKKEQYTGFIDVTQVKYIDQLVDLDTIRNPIITQAPGGVLGVTTKLISSIYTHPPASSREYFADLGQNLGLQQEVYAQEGFGFDQMSGLLPAWKAFRNISYFLFAVIFVITGLAIMFRLKINPQTVIGIQNAIPQLVISLILVTFSYAIVGLLIDFMYVIFGVSIYILESAAGKTPSYDLFQAGFTTALTETFAAPGWGWAAIGSIGMVVGAALGAVAGAVTAGLSIIGGAAAGGSLFILIVLLVVTVNLFKLLFSLIGSYVSIIFLTIFAPIYITAGALPGGRGGFGNWLRNLMGNILVFPAVGILFLLIRLIASLGDNLGSLWRPPFLPQGSVDIDIPVVDLLPTGSTNILIQSVISLGMIMLLPKVPQMVKDAFAVKPFPYGGAIGESLRPARVPGIAATSFLTNIWDQQALSKSKGSSKSQLSSVVRTLTGIRG